MGVVARRCVSLARSGMDGRGASDSFSVVPDAKASHFVSSCISRSAAICLFALTFSASGSVDPAGDPAFDSDQVASRSEPSRRWHSHPGGRLCLNPSSKRDFRIDPMGGDLSLDLGAYVGAKVIRLPHVLAVEFVNPDGTAASAAPVETWYPYKLGFESALPDGSSVSGFDFFPDSSPAMIRVLKVKGSAGAKLRLTGESPVQSVDGALTAMVEGCHYALIFRRLAGETLAASAIGGAPSVSAAGWNLELPVSEDGDTFAVGFGFATPEESVASAIGRAHKVLEQPVSTSLAKAKTHMDGLLRKVPVPASFNLVSGIPADRYRLAYYMAWTFLYQSTIDPLPEHPEYPFPQMSLGKGALWAEGHPKCPATCGWESFIGIQWLAMTDPEFGWQAYEGIMSLVDDHGQLGGESLPSRKAHTAWVLHQQKPDAKRLAEVYPAIRRYLLWREKNPRWIYGDNMAPDEKDIEFAASWMVDVEYAVQIAKALGNPDDAAMWRSRQDAMIESIRGWFFRDPEKLHQFYFAESGVHATPQRNQYRPIMILSALAVPRLPADMRARLTALLDECLKPAAPNAGFAYTKYPDNQFAAWGLIDHGMPQARPFIEAILRESILCDEFAETIELDEKGAARPCGVKPSLFTALNLVEFTWLLNGVRHESGRMVSCNIPGTTKP